MKYLEWYEKAKKEGEFMKNFIEEYKEENAAVQYCPYCMELRRNQLSCCGAFGHWIAFKDLDDNTQMEIIKEEYDSAYGVRK
jgi:hypothetical protein